MSERSAHSPCLRTLGCIYTRNHAGNCSCALSGPPSSVPVPRPSEPLPNDERNKADIVAALASGDPLALLKIKSRMDDEQIAELKAELARRSPSVPTATQEQREADAKLHGVVWALIDEDGRVVLERCEKKARVLGVGEWFLPGGKIEGDETPEECLRREIGEEWPGVELLTARPLPIVEGSSVPPGPRGLFLMRPFVVTVRGEVPSHSSEGTPLRSASIREALASPVPQVRMIVAAADHEPRYITDEGLPSIDLLARVQGEN